MIIQELILSLISICYIKCTVVNQDIITHRIEVALTYVKRDKFTWRIKEELELLAKFISLILTIKKFMLTLSN